MANPAYKQVELIVEWGEGIRSEEDAEQIVQQIKGWAERHGLAAPFVEDYDEED